LIENSPMLPRSLAAWVAALLFLLAGILPARATDFVDAAGRRVFLPPVIDRVMPAERNAEVLVYVLAPNKLAGVERGSMRRGPGRMPTLMWRTRTTPASMAETARQLRPQVIIDAAPVTPQAAAFADQVQQMTGIPYILVDDSFARIPAILRSVGALLGSGDRADDLAIFAEHAIAGLHGRLLIRPAGARPHVYYARHDGFDTALPGSPAGAAIDEAGAINVAAMLGHGGEARVSPEDIYRWDPTIILAEGRGAYDAFKRNPAMRRLSAVRNNRVYLIPSSPFGWVEDPSGVNRLIGLHWLSGLLYADATQEDLRTTACDFYDKFYRIKLTNGQLEAMLRPAGVPAPTVFRPEGEPLIGLGAAPPSSLPAGTPGAVHGGGAPNTPPGAPGAAASKGALPGVSPLGSMGSMSGALNPAKQTCLLPRGPNPMPLDQLPGLMNNSAPNSTAPGVPPPGRRGRPAALLQQAPEMTGESRDSLPPATSASIDAPRPGGIATVLARQPATVPEPLRLAPPLAPMPLTPVSTTPAADKQSRPSAAAKPATALPESGASTEPAAPPITSAELRNANTASASASQQGSASEPLRLKAPEK
jgi:iron complex transport system substrate-binding protein